MESQIRLADRMGLLQGRSLSIVQVRALQLLNELETQDEERRRIESDDRSFRLAILANSNLVETMEDVHRLFPEYAPHPQPLEAHTLTDEEFEEPGHWQFSDDSITPDMAAALISQSTSVQMSDLFGSLEDPDDEGWR